MGKKASRLPEELPITNSDLESFKKSKSNFDTLRGTRNHLVHGENDNPTNGESDLCVKTALAIAPLFQALDNEKVVTRLT
jgi:hypothetical protein